MALVDANLKFVCIDCGSYGKNSDGGIFANSAMGRRFKSADFNFPADEVIGNFDQIEPMPYVAVGDEALPSWNT